MCNQLEMLSDFILAWTVVVFFFLSLSCSSFLSSIFSFTVWFSIFSCSKSIKCRLEVQRGNPGGNGVKDIGDRMGMCTFPFFDTITCHPVEYDRVDTFQSSALFAIGVDSA